MATQLKDILSEIQNTNWDIINSFEVQITGKGIYNILNLQNLNFQDFQDAINKSVIEVNTPQFNSQNIETYFAAMWRLNNGRDEVYRFSITFRDFNQLALYRLFTKMYFTQTHGYFEDIKFNVHINKTQGLNRFNGDNSDNSNDTEPQLVFNFDDAIIDSISQLQFSNDTEAQVAQFTVEFKCGNPQWTSYIDLK
jgi:hypothetical protein